MNTHYLKTVQPFFDEVESDRKTAELRFDDRSFAVGDVLVLQEFLPSPAPGIRGALTGKELRAIVTHITRDYPALTPGYVMLSFKRKECCP